MLPFMLQHSQGNANQYGGSWKSNKPFNCWETSLQFGKVNYEVTVSCNSSLYMIANVSNSYHQPGKGNSIQASK